MTRSLEMAAIGASTVWRSGHSLAGRALVEEILSAGADGLELDCRISAALFEEMKPALDETRVFSVHNYFPVPDLLPPGQGSGDAFLLSALEEGERAQAVEYTIRSLRIAAALGARSLVVHLGEVDCASRGRDLVRLCQEKGRGEELERARLSLLEERRLKEQAHLDGLFASLDPVLEAAREIGVLVCVENRYYPHQIPSLEEVGRILDRYEGAPIRYWHDVGHAMIQEHLGFTGRLEWLIRYGKDLAGVHLHDAIGLRDHLAPGRGEVLFEELGPFLNPETTRIVEVHPFVEKRDLIAGIDGLRRRLGS